MTVKNAIEIKDLNYEIDGREILKNIDITLKNGEFAGIIGPNGSGKTTLLKCIDGILKSDGEIRINGQNTADLSVKKMAREVSLMHQNTSVSFPFSTLEIVLMGRYPHTGRFGNEGDKGIQIAEKNMRYTETEIFRDQPVNELSGGERQRVMFAKALTQDAEILMMDEPTASLDITHREQIFKFSKELSENGRTVIAAVHDLKIAAKYCTKLFLLHEGRLLAEGKPKEVLTSDNLSKAYGVNALVYKNRVTGQLDFYLHGKADEKKGIRVHVIGGGGSSSGVIRQLFEKGYVVTAGVFAHGDSDRETAGIFGIKYSESEPFSDIDDTAYEENIRMIKESSITILCNMPFGMQNLKNLEAAEYADKLVIIEDDDCAARDFTGGKATELYNRLRQNAVIVTSGTLHEAI